MPGPIPIRNIRKRKGKKVSEALGELGGAIGVLAEKRRAKRERERKARLEDEDRRIAAFERARRIEQEDVEELRAERRETRAQTSAEQQEAHRAHGRTMDERRADLDREKFEFDKTKPRGAGSTRRPFETEIRSARVKRLLTDRLEDSPFDQGFMAIARSFGNENQNINDANFLESLRKEVAEFFPKEEPVDHMIIVDYMLEHASELPWKFSTEDESAAVEKQKQTLRAKLANFLGKGLKDFTRSGLFPFSALSADEQEPQKPETIDDLIDQRLSQ